MPGIDGRLSDEETAKVLKWLEMRAPGHLTCPICATDKWALEPVLIEMRSGPATGTLHLGGPSVMMPVIPLVCKNCAYIIYFGAQPMGLLPQPKKEEEMKSNG